MKLTATHVVVDIGAKSEGMAPIAEILDHEGNPKFQPGDEIDVMRDKGETEEGYVNLSHLKAQRLRSWDEIERAYNEKKPLKGVVVERIKGGLPVHSRLSAFERMSSPAIQRQRRRSYSLSVSPGFCFGSLGYVGSCFITPPPTAATSCR